MSEIQQILAEGAKASKLPTILADQEVFSVAEAAAFLRTKPQTLDKWRLTRSGPPFSRIGQGRGKILYIKAQLVEWLNQNAMRAA